MRRFRLDTPHKDESPSAANAEALDGSLMTQEIRLVPQA